MPSEENAIDVDQSNSSIATDTAAANDSGANIHVSADNGVDLADIFEPYFRPDANTIVCGAPPLASAAVPADRGREGRGREAVGSPG